MTKLNEMWAALLAYLPQADANGHGVSWKRMCVERTAGAAYAAASRADAAAATAADAAYAADAAAADAAWAAAWAADACAADAEYYAQEAIDKIKRTAVAKERNT